MSIAARYSRNDQQSLFAKQSNKLKRYHLERQKLFESFFYGIDVVEGLTQKQKNQIITKYAAHKNIDHTSAYQILNEGLPAFYLKPDLDAGFFHQIDCSSLRGQPIAMQRDDSVFVSHGAIMDSEVLSWVFKSFGVSAIPAAWQGCAPEDMRMRITLSMPEKDLFHFYDGMKNMHEYFFGKNPSVQMDLFRQNVFKPI
jgi:hypothetical protein